MKEYKAEKAVPNPRSTINSYRSFGYTLSTAIADIIDNSISAGASKININYEWSGKDSYIYILDNGDGMLLPDLVKAMTPGSKNPDDIRGEKDLGRFGMGLKTASFSQCKRLTVASKKDGELNWRCWDIDFVNDEEEWSLLNYVSDISFLEPLSDLQSGTIVIWEKLDRIVGNSEINNEAVKSAFYSEFANVRDHLSMVYHKFLEKGTINIYINEVELMPWNPFLLDLDPKPEMGPVEILDGNVEVTYFILPHMSRISSLDYAKSGGPLGWFQQQGFYVYRGNRLLVAGDWLGLEKKREYSKLARICINFSNTKDFDWSLDIKKSTATPPIDIRKDLERIALIARNKSGKVYNWRAQKDLDNNPRNGSIQKLWSDETTREGIKKYKINRKHDLIKKAIDSDSTNSKLFSKSLKLIEENIPIELILYNQNENPSFHELESIPETPDDNLIKLAKELYEINIIQGVPKDLAAQQIMQTVPFNNFPLIKEYLK